MIPTGIVEFEDSAGRSPFGRWFDDLDAVAAAKVQTSLIRLGNGNTSSVKNLGAGVFETKIDFGPGYRVYFGKDGNRIIVLLGGGSKKRQGRDVADAKAAWAQYKARKKDQK